MHFVQSYIVTYTPLKILGYLAPKTCQFLDLSGVEVGDIIMGIEAPITKIMGKALKDLEANKTNEKNEWSREGCYNQMERGLNEGCGLYPPPHVLPYKPIGMCI